MAKIQTSLRLEEENFKTAKEILQSLGLNFSEAVNIFVAKVVQERGLPFEVKLPEIEPIEPESEEFAEIASIKSEGNEKLTLEEAKKVLGL